MVFVLNSVTKCGVMKCVAVLSVDVGPLSEVVFTGSNFSSSTFHPYMVVVLTGICQLSVFVNILVFAIPRKQYVTHRV